MTKLKDLLEHLAKKIVSKPSSVKVSEAKEDDGTIRLSFSVAPEDMGMIIGKRGKTIMAIRSLVKTAAAKAGKRVFLELEEEGGRNGRKTSVNDQEPLQQADSKGGS